MENTKEKRRDNRLYHEMPISCAYFNTPHFHKAKTGNFSSNGMHLISDHEFYPGSSVVIRTAPKDPGSNLEYGFDELRQITIAEVKWCRKVSENPANYAVGVKYFESWY